MIELSLADICTAVNGRIIGFQTEVDSNQCVDRVAIDSREVIKGDLFVPIVGENFDGHIFLAKAIEQGALVSLCEEDKLADVLTEMGEEVKEGPCLIVVDDTLKAFHRLGAWILKVLDIPAIGVTGSVGKTTTKEMIASVLEMKYKVHKNKGNFNNLIGVPLTLCDLQKDHEIVVLEMGMDRFGEIHELTNMVRPTCGVITNIGISHIEYLGSKEGIMKAKMEIVDSFDETSTLIINGDDDLLKTIDRDQIYETISCGFEEGNDIYVSDYRLNAQRIYGYDAVSKKGPLHVQLAIHGKHNITNSLLVIAVGQKFGVEDEAIAQGLNNYHASGRRMHVYELNKRITIINDTYNAATDSMIAGCQVLTSFEDSYKIAVLGDMLELGKVSEEEHRKVGDFFAKKAIEELYFFGGEMAYAYEGARACVDKEKSSSRKVMIFKEMDLLNQALKNSICNNHKNITIFVKGSLGMKMDRVIEMLEALNENVTDCTK